MTTVICSHDELRLSACPADSLKVLLYGAASSLGYGSIGNRIHDEFIKKLPSPPDARAIDFLTIALSVIAADTFVLRANSADRWVREIHLIIELANPSPWYATVSNIERALSFLSGDKWNIEIRANGYSPAPMPKQPGIPDCVCLFSGGLDSAVGAVDLLSKGRKPLLVSHAYSKDRQIQQLLLNRLGTFVPYSVGTNVNATRVQLGSNQYINDTSMRARSLLFLALGAVAASSVSSMNAGAVTELYVPENGFISVNPPLTNRRLGSQSTRTTHPNFLRQIQLILDSVGLPVKLINPYRGLTKGQMLKQCANQQLLSKIAKSTVSCGKWKRKNKQCGRCLPCLIRRAALHAASMADNTDNGYVDLDLKKIMKNELLRDDVLAVMIAIDKYSGTDMVRWAIANGPLPGDVAERQLRIAAVQNGLAELEDFLRHEGCIP